jgi:hypothetical protein
MTLTLTTLTQNESGTDSLSNINDNFSTINTGKADLASPTFTGNPRVPTQSSNDNSTKIASTSYVDAQHIGYVLQAFGQSFSPADATTYYIGSKVAATGSTADVNRIYIPKAGTVKGVYLYFNNSGTLGTTETSTVSFRLNNTTDTTVSAVVTNDAASTAFSNASMSVAVVAGDYFELKWVAPTWATNPTNVVVSAVIYIE